MPDLPAGDSHVARNRLWTRLSGAVAALDPPPSTPLMVVDLDAFDANARDLAGRAGGKPIRVASKSLRVPALIARALAAPGFGHPRPLPCRGGDLAVLRRGGQSDRARSARRDRSPGRTSRDGRWPGR